MKKVLLILGAVLLGTMIAIGGCKVQEKSQKEQMLEIVKSDEMKDVLKRELTNMDHKAFISNGIIKSYKIDYDSVKHNPMGGIMVTIYVNDNPKYDVTFIINKHSSDNKLHSEGEVHSEELDKLLKGK